MTTQTFELAWTAQPVNETITPAVEAAIPGHGRRA
jgi:hypothetical protein